MKSHGFIFGMRANSVAAFLIIGLAAGFLCSGTSAQDTNQMMQQSQDAKIVTDSMALIRKHEFQKAREMLLSAANKGYPESQALLGQMCEAGWGMAPDYDQAFKWWSRAAEAGSADGQWGLGLLYDEGKGVPQDSKRAAELWTKAVQKGNMKSMMNLAFLYDEGRGVEMNQKESAKLFKMAAERGEPFAQVNYGLKLIKGTGVEMNVPLGCAWLCVASESPRIKGSRQETKILHLRDEALARLSSDDQHSVQLLKKQIESKIKLN